MWNREESIALGFPAMSLCAWYCMFKPRKAGRTEAKAETVTSISQGKEQRPREAKLLAGDCTGVCKNADIRPDSSGVFVRA